MGLLQAKKVISKVKPDVILTFGGYIGLPVAYAAKLAGIPVVLHEQTQNAGLASKLISKIASKICISFRSSEGHFPKNTTIFTGDPLRPEVFKIESKIDFPKGAHKVIYITGGSTGSHFINSKMYKIAEDLLSDYVLIHQTGESAKFNDYERLEKMRDAFPEDKKKRYILRKFIYPDEIGFVLSSADLLVSRSGANTIFEIMAKKKVSLLIPLPYGQNNEQLENAKLIQKIGIGEYVREEDASDSILTVKIKEMIENSSLYVENMKKSEEFVVEDAAMQIADIVESYGKKRS
jgi:UDP-N-acetylglucosamine--N-acetylmuramyl-(pentapeptide) pyrophosphoryl-undecaprenol N-acetylglucosamine transferase